MGSNPLAFGNNENRNSKYRRCSSELFYLIFWGKKRNDEVQRDSNPGPLYKQLSKALHHHQCTFCLCTLSIIAFMAFDILSNKAKWLMGPKFCRNIMSGRRSKSNVWPGFEHLSARSLFRCAAAKKINKKFLTEGVARQRRLKCITASSHHKLAGCDGSAKLARADIHLLRVGPLS